ncbi:hypothetical protein ACLBXB_09000 [Methylobacterium mesophilicum]
MNRRTRIRTSWCGTGFPASRPRSQVAQPGRAELGDRRGRRQGLALVQTVAAGDDVGDETVDQAPERVAVVVQGPAVQGVGVAALLLEQDARDHDVRGVDGARDDAHGLGQVEHDALDLADRLSVVVRLDQALATPVELQQDVVEPLLADHLRRPFEDVRGRDHVADQQLAEVIAAHRDRDGEVGLGSEADREDRRQMRLPGPAQRGRIAGGLEAEAGDAGGRGCGIRFA